MIGWSIRNKLRNLIDMITKKLTREEQSEILEVLFGFSFDDDVLIDDDGEEFYSIPMNCQFDFSTLSGIFSYVAHRSKEQGFKDCQYQIKKALGID